MQPCWVKIQGPRTWDDPKEGWIHQGTEEGRGEKEMDERAQGLFPTARMYLSP